MSLKPLTVVLDRDDVRRAFRHERDTLTGSILAWDLPAHLELLDRGIAHYTPWDFVSTGDWPQVRRFEQRVQAFWHDHAHLPYAGMDLLAMARFRHVACFARLAWAAYGLRGAVNMLRPTKVCVFDDEVGHGLEQPPGCARMPLLQPLLRGIAEQAGVHVEVLRVPRREFQDVAAMRAGQSAGPGLNLGELAQGRPYIIFAGSDGDLIRQLPLIRELRSRSRLAIVQLYRSADDATLQALRANGHVVLHEQQVKAPHQSPGDVDIADFHAARERFERAGCGVAPELRCLFANPHLAPHFDFIFGAYARRMAGHVRKWQDVFRRQPPRLVVANYPAPIFEVAAHCSIPALLLPHGVMTAGDPRWYACLPRVILGAATPAHSDRLLGMGVPSDRIRLTGDPGLACDQPAAPPVTVTHAPPRILLLTSAIAAPAHQADLPQINWSGAARTFRALADLARRRPNWEFIIRPHPRYDQIELYERLCATASGRRPWAIDDQTPLATLAAACHAVLAVNNRSSAIVEAALHGAAVLLFCPDVVDLDLAAWGLNAWPQARTIAELEQDLERLCDDPRHRSRRVGESNAAARRFTGDSRLDGVTGCAAVVAELAAAGRRDTATERAGAGAPSAALF